MPRRDVIALKLPSAIRHNEQRNLPPKLYAITDKHVHYKWSVRTPNIGYDNDTWTVSQASVAAFIASSKDSSRRFRSQAASLRQQNNVKMCCFTAASSISLNCFFSLIVSQYCNCTLEHSSPVWFGILPPARCSNNSPPAGNFRALSRLEGIKGTTVRTWPRLARPREELEDRLHCFGIHVVSCRGKSQHVTCDLSHFENKINTRNMFIRTYSSDLDRRLLLSFAPFRRPSSKNRRRSCATCRCPDDSKRVASI